MVAQAVLMLVLAGYGPGGPGGPDDWVFPAASGSVRAIVGDHLVLQGMLIKITGALEDRAIVEFDVSRLDAVANDIFLQLYINNRDPLIPVGQVDLHTFSGDGLIETGDFFAGTTFAAVATPGTLVIERIDVTDAVRGVVADGGDFLGLRFSTESSDRYELGAIVGLPPPYLDPVPIPEPATLLMLGVGAALVLRRRGAVSACEPHV